MNSLNGGHDAPEVLHNDYDGVRIGHARELDGTMVHKYEMEAGVPVEIAGKERP